MGLLKTIFFLLLFYYGFKFIAKLIAPFLINKVASSMQQKAAQQFGKREPKNTVKEGETIIDKAPKKQSQSKNSVGEYVDFEEID